MSIWILLRPFPTGLGSTFVTVITGGAVLSVELYHDGQHGGDVVDDETSELEHVVLIDDEIAYFAKLSHLSISHSFYLMLLFLLANKGVHFDLKKKFYIFFNAF